MGEKDVIKNFEDLQFTDAFMFAEVMKNKKLCKRLLECILDKELKEIETAVVEYEQKSIPGYRGIRLDVHVTDIQNNYYNIEMQVLNKYDIPRRSRFYQGLMDTKMLKSGVKSYNELKDVFVIFICLFDPFGEGFMKYTFSKLCEEKRELPLNDGAKTIIINGSWKSQERELTELEDFVYYIENPIEYKAQKELAKSIDEDVKQKKQDQKVRDGYMTLAEIIEDAIQSQKERTQKAEEEKERIREEKDKEIQEKEEQIQEKEEQIQEKEKQIQEKEEQLKEQQRLIEELQKKLESK